MAISMRSLVSLGTMLHWIASLALAMTSPDTFSTVSRYNGMIQVFLSFFLCFLFAGELRASVTDIGCKHNLSYRTSHPGVDILATSETQVCKFCHIPHGALVSDTTQYQWYDDIYLTGQTAWTDGPQTWRLPLISHQLTVQKNYVRVSLSTGIWQTTARLDITISTWAYGPISNISEVDPDGLPDTGDETWQLPWMPSGSSRVCFSCHDGSLPVGRVRTSTGGLTNIDMDNEAAGNKLVSDDRIGSGSPARFLYSDVSYNFATRHPSEHAFYSFYMREEVLADRRGTTRALKALSQMKEALDRYSFAQCTACHDPHKYDATTGGHYQNGSKQFWRKPGTTTPPDDVCNDCHD